MSVMSFNTTASINDEVITALTDVIAGNIFPHIAFASIIKIIANPKRRLVLDSHQ